MPRNEMTETGVKFLAHGFRITSENTSLKWWIFDNDEIVQKLGGFSEMDYSPAGSLGEDLTGEHSYHSQPGGPFAERPIARIGKYHTIVIQRTGLDV